MQYNNMGNNVGQNKFCMNCGNPLDGRQKFCTKCGHPVNFRQEYASSVPTYTANNQFDERKTYTDEESKKILAYVVKGQTASLVIGVITILLGIFCAWETSILCFFIALAIAAFMFWVALSNKIRIKKELSQMEQDPVYDTLCTDFENGTRFLGDKLRIGQVFVFGQNSDNISKISDITRVYQYVHKTNYVEDSRELRITVNGKEKTLCHVKLKKAFEKKSQDSDEMIRIVHFLLNKNPGIKVGYR